MSGGGGERAGGSRAFLRSGEREALPGQRAAAACRPGPFPGAQAAGGASAPPGPGRARGGVAGGARCEEDRALPPPAAPPGSHLSRGTAGAAAAGVGAVGLEDVTVLSGREVDFQQIKFRFPAAY